MAARLGQKEGVPADNLKVSETVTSGTSASGSGSQLSAIAGSRRSRGSEPRATVFSTAKQKSSYYEKFQKIVKDNYAQYTALGRKQAKQQQEETELWETQKKQQKEESERQQEEESAAETARQQKETEAQKKQQEESSNAQAEQYAKELAEQQRQYDEEQKLLEKQSEAAKAAQEEYEKTQTAELERQTAAAKKQYEEYYANLAAEQEASQEAEKSYYREQWEEIIDQQRDTYMLGAAQQNPDAMLEYDEALAQTVYDEDRYTGVIPDMPEELYTDDENYAYKTKLPSLEDYLVAYEDNFNTIPALSPVFWQLDPEDRQGYLDAYENEMNPTPEGAGLTRQEYLNQIGFELDASKPLIKQTANLHGSSQKYAYANTYDYTRTSKYTAPTDTATGGTAGQAAGTTTSAGQTTTTTTQAGQTTSTTTQRTYDQARTRYLEDNPDVARAGMDPWVHYTQFGQNEGRVWPGATNPGGGSTSSGSSGGGTSSGGGSTSSGSSGGSSSQSSVNANLTYDQAAAQYLNEYDDVREAGIDPWTHYITFGKSEGRAWRGAEKSSGSSGTSVGTSGIPRDDWWYNLYTGSPEL